MKYVILSFIFLIGFIFVILYFIKKKRIIYKVKHMSEKEKLCVVNKMLEPFGFSFDIKEDIVISRNDAWQRDMGYSDIYDLKAPLFNIVMDAEPIYFKYDKKDYRIEFWKGQYGITTGAEVGIYVRDKNKKFMYHSINDSEILPIRFELYKKCFLFSRCGCTWWLTGFSVGEFSRPKDLLLKVSILFPNQSMQVAFVEGLLNAGYTSKQIKVYGYSVCFSICSPKNRQLNTRHKLWKCLVQIINYINCKIYGYFTRPFNRTLDKLAYIRFMFPYLYLFIIKLCIPRKKGQKYCKKKN